MEEELCNIQNLVIMKVNGKVTKNMDQVLNIIKQATFMKEIGNLAKKMVLESTNL